MKHTPPMAVLIVITMVATPIRACAKGGGRYGK